jgi:hypothetical protein
MALALALALALVLAWAHRVERCVPDDDWHREIGSASLLTWLL